jgi:hypothetical protein
MEVGRAKDLPATLYYFYPANEVEYILFITLKSFKRAANID